MSDSQKNLAVAQIKKTLAGVDKENRAEVLRTVAAEMGIELKKTELTEG
ncbi:MAG: hypothetical protein PHZ04_03005 [Patescibacteria group bacterium]|nr:hypothetical protein [Patescibacteria group bacterium]MDD5294380.1 hypothetical protein [Patescibacteria group bacterium]MDD5554673.1 hypothetical protein [Patescibacteria group bacterium]